MALLEDEFGDIVRKARAGLGLTLAEAAKRAGISPERLGAFESYQAAPRREESDALARALGLASVPLWEIAAGEYAPDAGSPRECEVVPFTFQPMASHGYLIHVAATGDTFLVDPGGPPDGVFAALEERGWELRAVLLTHGHSDHVGGLERVLQAFSVPVYAHPSEYNGEKVLPVTAPAELTAGATRLRVLHTPGHTPGGLTFVLAGVAAVGDTLFAGSLGRAYRGPESYDRLLASARLILSLPDETLLLPGHGPVTTVGLEKRHNPFVAA